MADFLKDGVFQGLTGLIGTIVGVIGFGLTLWQVYKIRKSTELVVATAMSTQRKLVEKLTLIDASEMVARIKLAKTLLRSKDLNGMDHQIDDLKTLVINSRAAAKNREVEVREFDAALSHLIELSTQLAMVRKVKLNDENFAELESRIGLIELIFMEQVAQRRVNFEIEGANQ